MKEGSHRPGCVSSSMLLSFSFSPQLLFFSRLYSHFTASVFGFKEARLLLIRRCTTSRHVFWQISAAQHAQGLRAYFSSNSFDS